MGVLEDTETKLETLRELLDDGEKSGSSDYSYENFIFDLDNKQ